MISIFVLILFMANVMFFTKCLRVIIFSYDSNIFKVEAQKIIITLLMPFSVQNLKEIEEHLKNHPTLSEGGVPGPCDASIYLALGSTFIPIQNYQKNQLIQTFITGTFSLPISVLLLFRDGLIKISQRRKKIRKIKKKRRRNRQRKKKMMISILLQMKMQLQNLQLSQLLLQQQRLKNQNQSLNQLSFLRSKSMIWRLTLTNLLKKF